MITLAEIKDIVENRPLIGQGDYITKEAMDLIEQCPQKWRSLLFVPENIRFDAEISCPICGKTTLARRVGKSVIIESTYKRPGNTLKYLCPECREKRSSRPESETENIE